MLGHFLNFDILRLWEEGLQGLCQTKIWGFYKETEKNVQVLSSAKKRHKIFSETLIYSYFGSGFWKDEVAFILSTQFLYKASVSWGSS